MIIIRHRINKINDLISIPPDQGIEIDLRSFDGELIVEHDPFKNGEKFIDWIRYFHHKQLVLNVKEDGLENFIIGILEELKISSYFFLDQPFPSLYKLSRIMPRVCSTRVSEYESIESALLLNPGWVWFDSHTGNWDYLRRSFDAIRETPIKTCLVSPELQRQKYGKEITDLKSRIGQLSINFDAVCTKLPHIWQGV
jgi:hypothetical protein